MSGESPAGGLSSTGWEAIREFLEGAGVAFELVEHEPVMSASAEARVAGVATGGGDRLVYEMWIKPSGRTIFNRKLQVGYTREGVTFGVEAGGKRPECCVTGGVGTIAVSYKGTTYYVCCSGCREAFQENPEKYVAEFQRKKKGK